MRGMEKNNDFVFDETPNTARGTVLADGEALQFSWAENWQCGRYCFGMRSSTKLAAFAYCSFSFQRFSCGSE